MHKRSQCDIKNEQKHKSVEISMMFSGFIPLPEWMRSGQPGLRTHFRSRKKDMDERKRRKLSIIFSIQKGLNKVVPTKSILKHFASTNFCFNRTTNELMLSNLKICLQAVAIEQKTNIDIFTNESRDEFDPHVTGFLFGVNLEGPEIRDTLTLEQLEKQPKIRLVYFEHFRIFGLITNLDKYLKQIRCEFCGLISKRESRSQIARHINRCRRITQGAKVQDETCFAKKYKNIFEQISTKTGMDIEMKAKLMANNFLCFDIECFLKPIQGDPNDLLAQQKMHFENQHVLVSIQCCSNVNGFTEPKIFVTENADESPSLVLPKFVSYLQEVQAKCLSQSLADDEVFSLVRRIEILRDHAIDSRNKYEEMVFGKALKDIEQHYTTLVCFAYNSARYDNYILIRQGLIDILEEKFQTQPNVLLRGNDILQISIPGKLKFLDFYRFQSNASLRSLYKSYSESLKNVYDMDISDIEKAYLPYDKVCASKEEMEAIPIDSIHYEDFKSSLTQQNELNADFERFQELLDRDVSVENAKKQLGVKSIPEKGEIVFEKLKKDWAEKKIENFFQIFELYSIRDVQPLVPIVQSEAYFYAKLGLYIGDFTGIPSISEAYFFRSAENSYWLQPNQKMAISARNSIVGGYSGCLMSRHCIVNKTRIAPHEYGLKSSLCKSIQGFDCNSMYLSALTAPLPSGIYVVRQKDDNWAPVIEGKEKTHLSLAFMALVCELMGWEFKKVQHMCSPDSEARISVCLGENQSPLSLKQRELDFIKSFYGIVWYNGRILQNFQPLSLPINIEPGELQECGYERQFFAPENMFTLSEAEKKKLSEKPRKRFFKSYKVDGYLELFEKCVQDDGTSQIMKHKVVFEMMDDFTHSLCQDCPGMQDTEYCNPFTKKSHEQQRTETLRRLFHLSTQRSISLIFITDCKFKRLLKENAWAQSFYENFNLMGTGPLIPSFKDEAELISAILDKRIEGLVECKISVPQSDRHKFSRFPPCFSRKGITEDTIKNTPMADMSKAISESGDGILKTPRELVCLGFESQGMFSTRYIRKMKTYFNVDISELGDVYEMKVQRVFKATADFINEQRSNSKSSIASQKFKLIGNSFYGRLLLDSAKFTTIKYMNEQKASRWVNNPRFVDLADVSYDPTVRSFFQVRLQKSTIKDKSLSYLGLCVLQEAKLMILR